MFNDGDLLEGDLTKRDLWLKRLLAHMKSCGWVARPGSEWDDSDIEVHTSGAYPRCGNGRLLRNRAARVDPPCRS